MQVFADQKGNTVHVFERECSIQRRHQKVVEESPSPFITPAMRSAMGEVAVKAAQAVNYCGAGTIEFLADADRNFYFLEMNTRIQVEHPMTEMVTGVDLVKAQIEVAAGAPLPFRQQDLSSADGRSNAASTPRIPRPVSCPRRAGSIRCVGRADPACATTPASTRAPKCRSFYDPMISKLAVWGRDRAEAIARMRRALSEFAIAGELTTNLDFHRWLMNHPVFLGGDYDTNFIEQEYHPKALAAGDGKPERRDDRQGIHRRDAGGGGRRAESWAMAAAPRAAGAGRGAARGGSAWKTLGRLDVLRR